MKTGAALFCFFAALVGVWFVAREVLGEKWFLLAIIPAAIVLIFAFSHMLDSTHRD